MRTTILLLMVLLVSGTRGQDTPATITTRWECSVALTSPYNASNLMNMKGEVSSATERTPWQVAFGRRVGERWILSAQYERTVVRHGQGLNDEYLGSDYNWALLWETYTTTYRTDLLTTEQAMSTAMLQAAYIFRPYRMRKTFGFAFRGEAALCLHRISAEQGVLADHINSYTSDSFLGIGFLDQRDVGSDALDLWNMRTVVNAANSTGLSFALNFRADLHCTRHFSLFSTAGMNVPLAKPHFDAYAVPDTDMEFAAYSVDLTAMRFGVGAAVHF